MDFSWISDPQALAGLFALLALEIVLGIDNIVFLSILTAKLPEAQRAKARFIGLGLALVMRLALLFSITWIMSLKTDVFALELGGWKHGFSWKDVILISGGLFLIWKAVHEIHAKLEGVDHTTVSKVAPSFGAIIAQIVVIDLVFSLDSVITAVGMVKHIEIMVISVVVAIAFMLAFAGKVSDFVEKHPTVKMLALAFLVLIGVNLLAEGSGQHIEKGFTYFAMAFSVGVEMLNLKMMKGQALRLKNTPKDLLD